MRNEASEELGMEFLKSSSREFLRVFGYVLMFARENEFTSCESGHRSRNGREWFPCRCQQLPSRAGMDPGNRNGSDRLSLHPAQERNAQPAGDHGSKRMQSDHSECPAC